MVSWTEEDAREKWEAEHRERCERDRRDGYYRAALQGVLASMGSLTAGAGESVATLDWETIKSAKWAADAMLAIVDAEER